MTDWRKMADESACKDGHGCHPHVCVCAALDEAVDEIERLTAARQLMQLDAEKYRDESWAKDAEIERLREREAELQAQCGYTDSIRTLEIERLRAALWQIVDYEDSSTDPGILACARAALSTGERGNP